MRLTPVIAVLTCLAAPVAAETTLSAGATLELYHDPAGAGSGDETDVSVYGEADFNGLYVGASALRSTDEVVDKYSLGFGYRGSVAEVDYDLGLTRYVYPNDGASNYSELVLGLSKGFTDQFSGTLDLGYDATNKAGNAYVGAAYTLSDKVELSANFGVYEVAAAPSESEWDLGATYSLTDELAADLRWYDGTDYTDGYVGLIFSWDTSLTK